MLRFVFFKCKQASRYSCPVFKLALFNSAIKVLDDSPDEKNETSVHNMKKKIECRIIIIIHSKALLDKTQRSERPDLPTGILALKAAAMPVKRL